MKIIFLKKKNCFLSSISENLSMSLIFCGTWHRHNKRHIPGETVLCTYIWSLSQVKLQHNESSVRERTNPSLSPRGRGAYELNARWAKGSQVRLETGISSR